MVLTGFSIIIAFMYKICFEKAEYFWLTGIFTKFYTDLESLGSDIFMFAAPTDLQIRSVSEKEKSFHVF